MVDKKAYKKKVILNLVTHPVTIWPFVAGITTIIAGWTLNYMLTNAVFLGLAGMLTSLGTGLTRALLWTDEIAKEALKEIKFEANQATENSLNELYQRLALDNDPRTEQLLNDLRTLINAFKEEKEWPIDPHSTFEIITKVEELFGECVKSLEQTLLLFNTAQKIETAEVKQSFLQQREQIILDVSESIKQLGMLLTEIQKLGIGDSSNNQMTAIRKELNATLETARLVQERVNEWKQDHNIRTH